MRGRDCEEEEDGVAMRRRQQLVSEPGSRGGRGVRQRPQRARRARRIWRHQLRCAASPRRCSVMPCARRAATVAEARRTRRRRTVSAWCGRARRARRVRAGRAGRRGTPGVCRRRRRSLAYVAGVLTEHGATGVDAPDRVRGLGHDRDATMTGAAATTAMVGTRHVAAGAEVRDDGEQATHHSVGQRRGTAW
ncbi:hypothetical protein VPH35_073362 [Triticum aestivum]